MSLVGVWLIIIGFVTIVWGIGAIVMFIKSIIDKVNMKKDVSIKTIWRFEVNSIILIVLNVCNFVLVSFFAIPGIIISIISLVKASAAKKLFETENQLARIELNSASILNIISSAILLLEVLFLIAIIVLAVFFASFR